MIVFYRAGKYIHFCFITGVSRFSKMSVFSELNHLIDISLDSQFAGMLGYTQEELMHYFTQHLQVVAHRRKTNLETLIPVVKKWYNGYSWDGETFVYNPFSFMNFCREASFYNYWFDTGTPTFLTKLLHKDFQYNFDQVEVPQFGLSSTSIEHIDNKALLFQAGYLTIKAIKILNEKSQYVLEYPNIEVKDALFQYMYMEFSSDYQLSNLMPKMYALTDCLKNRNITEFVRLFNTLFANIPHQIFIAHLEAYYHAIVYIALQLIGIDIRAEVSQSQGRADAIIFLDNLIYILEFKLDESAAIAVQQIKDKQYAAPYTALGCQIYLLGLNMTSADRKITNVLCELMR